MKEIQAIVNSRPLALNDMSSTDSPQPLTPNHHYENQSNDATPRRFPARRPLPSQEMEKGSTSCQPILGQVEKGIPSRPPAAEEVDEATT